MRNSIKHREPGVFRACSEVSRRWDLDACRWTYWLADGQPLPSGYYLVIRPENGDAGKFNESTLLRGPFEGPEAASTALHELEASPDATAAEARVALWQPATTEH